MNGMAAVADEVLGNVTSALRARGMWARTLLLHSSDNGAPAGLLSSGHSGNNWPLRGGKGNLFEGSTEPRPESARQSTRVAVRAETHRLSRSGVRVPAFVAGGFVPAAARGTQAGGYVHICDTTALEHLPLLLRLCYFPFAAARIPLLAAGDWYRTLLRLAGGQPDDAPEGLPPSDSLDVWDHLRTGGKRPSPRSQAPREPGACHTFILSYYVP